ncbi:MAG: ferritin family protein [Anaerolineae bacterium]|jgi:rubrerythrin
MRMPWSREEALEIAIEAERQEGAFYDRAAERATTGRLREVCADLAEAEAKHERLFRELLRQRDLTRAVASLYPEDEADRYHRYVMALVESNILPDRESAVRLADEASTALEVVHTALQMEKNTILFYRQLEAMLGEDIAGLDAVLREERDHVYELNELRKSLQA